jgi:hypothetical protein
VEHMKSNKRILLFASWFDTILHILLCYIIYEFPHSSFEVNPQRFDFQRKTRWNGGEGFGESQEKEEENVSKRDMV